MLRRRWIKQYTVAEAVSGIDGMMDAAPKAEESSSALGRVSSMLGGGSSKLGKTAALADSFNKLGLGSDISLISACAISVICSNIGSKN